ncbi:MAG TPA: hypothetical protein VMZ52_11810, partial [Bryobacteraceae bacterium]|nr:hypothetical protein [Bryobacteraceae bacterium]
TLKTHAPDAASLGGCLGLPEALREAVYSRLLAKLKREPVEYFQIDFEEGYGNRSEAEEDRHAVLAGSVFDDAATGQGLLNYFLRAYDCGAITEEETLRSGLTLEELRSQSFLKILEGRRTHATG